MQKWQIHFHSPCKDTHFLYNKETNAYCVFIILTSLTLREQRGATKGCRYLSRGCTCLKCTNKTNDALLAYLVHYYLVGALETSAPPESTP